MQNKKIKIILFSVSDSGAKEFELSWRKLYGLFASLFLVILAIVAMGVGLFTDFYHNIDNSALRKTNALLKASLSQMGESVNHIQSQMALLENKDDELRLIADLPEIDMDTRNVGVGGFLDVSARDIPMSDPSVASDLMIYQEILGELSRRIELSKASQEEIGAKLEDNQKKNKHTPSIRPTLDGKIKDRFGFRLDPIIEKIKHHYGIDIAAQRGTEVLATADGVVEKVVTQYTANRSYGKYVIINHGYGVRTLYGHLARVLVRNGERVDRWKPIGLVGETGRATGPHLHYEVIREGKQEDPLKFILNDDVF